MRYRTSPQLFVAIALTAVFLTGCSTLQMPSPASTATVAPANTAVPSQPFATPVANTPTAGQTVSAPAHGYWMVLPSEWEACTTTDYSWVYCSPQAESGTSGFPAFYISVIPEGFTNDQASVYNFMPEEVIRRFLALPMGETLTTGDPNPEHSTFTRLPDATIAGETWAVIENTRVWEGGPDTRDRRLIVAHGDMTYVVGAYYETQMDLDEFEAVLATFAFTP